MLRVLVVDDDRPIRNLVTTVLSRRGLTVDGAPDGFAALRLIGDNDYEVAVVDLMMPGMNGIELLERVKAAPRHPQTIIVLTASGPGDVRQLDPGAVHAIMRKPFDINELADVVESAARAAAGRHNAAAPEANVVMFPAAERPC